MLHRRVGDLMSTAVVSVRRETGFMDVAERLAEHDITAGPAVVDQDRPIGVVSEADLLRKQESQTVPGGHLTAAHLRPAERAKAQALTAEKLMTSPAVTARHRGGRSSRRLAPWPTATSNGCPSRTTPAGWWASSAVPTCCTSSCRETSRSGRRS